MASTIIDRLPDGATVFDLPPEQQDAATDELAAAWVASWVAAKVGQLRDDAAVQASPGAVILLGGFERLLVHLCERAAVDPEMALTEWLAEPSLPPAGQIACAHCGHVSNGETPEENQAAICEHMAACPKHPMRAVEAELVRLRSALEAYGRHHNGCAYVTRAEECDCGYTAALKIGNAPGEA